MLNFALLLSAVWLYVLQYFVTVGIIFNPIFLFFLSLFFCSLYDSITNHTIVTSSRIDLGTLPANGGGATKTATINIPSGYSVLTVFPMAWYGCDNFSTLSISGSTITVKAANLTANPHGAWIIVGVIYIKNG